MAGIERVLVKTEQHVVEIDLLAVHVDARLIRPRCDKFRNRGKHARDRCVRFSGWRAATLDHRPAGEIARDEIAARLAGVSQEAMGNRQEVLVESAMRRTTLCGFYNPRP